MSNKRLVIGTRSSQLALWQADYIAERLQKTYPDLIVEKQLITTKGDKILDAPLAKIGGKGLFTKELETAMLAGEIDIAVHSLKDMPVEVPEGLIIGAVTQREDPGDVLVSPKYKLFDKLPVGAKVGTSSLRRKAQLLSVRPDLNICDLRGNVNTRLKKLVDEHFDGIVLAAAGLKRLGFSHMITDVIDPAICLPAVGQGALAVECRCNDTEVTDLIAFLNDDDTLACTKAERAFLRRVQGGCQVPVGVYGTMEQGRLQVEGIIASLDGRRIFRDCTVGEPEQAESLGQTLADKLLAAGGREVLMELGIDI